jgi:hypothetical protein
MPSFSVVLLVLFCQRMTGPHRLGAQAKGPDSLYGAIRLCVYPRVAIEVAPWGAPTLFDCRLCVVQGCDQFCLSILPPFYT